MVEHIDNAAVYYLAVLPIVIFILWTWLGNWYTYSLGWMLMTLDMGLWSIDFPNAMRHLWHINTGTNGWRWYFASATWLILVSMTWRGIEIIGRLIRDKRERREEARRA
jgi:hypothetical protein